MSDDNSTSNNDGGIDPPAPPPAPIRPWSQAYDNMAYADNEHVNPRTGSLTFSTTLFNLKGIKSSVDSAVKLTYSYGSKGTFGLPQNWGLDLPIIVTEGNSQAIVMESSSYIVNPNWVDSTGYKSGMQYVNDHGMSLVKQATPTPLPFSPSASYIWKLQCVDGSVYYFNDGGFVIGQMDLYGNHLSYNYSAVGGQEGHLTSIQDSWQQKINFDYTDGSKLIITIPDGHTTTIALSSEGVSSYSDFVGDVATFSFQRFNVGAGDDTQVLSTIAYPSGATSSFVYTGLQFLDANGLEGELPAVAERSTVDSGNNILTHQRYTYGQDLGQHTYTGFSIGLRTAVTGDALMDATTASGMSYMYDVIKTELGAKGDTLAQTHTYYNHLHLQIKETQLNTLASGSVLPAYQTSNTYDPTNLATTNCFDKPITTESFHNTGTSGTPSWQPSKQTSFTYNPFGNALTVQEQMFDMASFTFVGQRVTTNTYFDTPFQTQVLQTSQDVDQRTNVTYWTNNTLTLDSKGIATTELTYSLVAPGTLKWKTRFYVYDAQGRVIAESLAWSAGYNVPVGSVSSVVSKKAFSNLQNGLLTTTAMDAFGNPTVMTQDMRKNTGPLISKILPGGQSDVYDYDAAGRMIKHTDSLGNITLKTYSIGPNVNCETTTTPLGYIMLTNYDAIGREISKLDNGNVNASSQKATRILSANSYDALSRVLTATDKLGLVTAYTYDNLSRLLSVTDAEENVITYSYDDTNLQITQRLNGDLRSIETLNGRMQVVGMDKHADSGDTFTDYYLREQTTYDGEARIIFNSVSKVIDGISPLLLQSETVTYGPESAVLSRTVIGRGRTGDDIVLRDYTFDLFGNVYTYMKKTVYAATGQSFQHAGPTSYYNGNNQLVKAVNQENGIETWIYNTNGWLSQSVRLDGTSIGYTYDAAGHNIATIYSESISNTAYDEDGRIVETMSISGSTRENLRYSYSLDGTLLQTTYPNNSKQRYVLDHFSRIISATDVLGIITTTSYTSFGEVAQMSCNGDTVSYNYGLANHTQGKLLAISATGTQDYQKTIKYDGFDRLSEEQTQDSKQGNMLDTKYTADAIGRLVSCTSTSIYPGLVEGHVYEYDGLNQIVLDQRTSGNGTTNILYAYDGNSNVTLQESNGVTATMSYNKIDQRVDAGFAYDINGNLVHDAAGQSYAFDERDRLSNVISTSQMKKIFSYHPNEYLASCLDTVGNGNKMFYDGDKINVIQSNTPQGLQKTSIFRDARSIVANYTHNGSKSFYLARQGSTALIWQPGTNTPTSLTYSAYGVAEPSAAVPPQSSFAFKQEYTEPASQLVYLRSRYYNPNMASFISMDTYREENRYAYCKGDPINLIDSTGRWPSWLKKVASRMAGVAVEPLASFVVGLSLTAAMGGTAGSTAYPIQQRLIGAPIGASTGAITSQLGQAAVATLGPAIMSRLPSEGFKFVGKSVAKGETKIVSAGIKKAVSAAATKAAGEAITTSVHIAWTIGSNIKHGDPAEMAQMIASGHKSVLSPQTMATIHLSRESTGSHVAMHQQQQSSSVEGYIYQPLSLDISSGGALL